VSAIDAYRFTWRECERKESAFSKRVVCSHAYMLDDVCVVLSFFCYFTCYRHGRIAMFAFVGYIVHANGIKFPWAMQMDGSPFPSETNPPALWDAISNDAKWQIFSLIAFLEFWSELSTPEHKHYMRGGKPGDFPDFVSGPTGIPHPVPFNYFDPFKLSKNKSEEAKARGLKSEINNGRLAMIGILGFLTEQTTPGSVPLLSGIVKPYAGEVMAPFNENYLGMPFGM
jgi:hypothetical protein